jgi:hypothetical protein
VSKENAEKCVVQGSVGKVRQKNLAEADKTWLLRGCDFGLRLFLQQQGFYFQHRSSTQRKHNL